MYYTNLLSIKSNDYVLEVGPGSSPFWRSNVLVDKYDNNDEVPIGNFGKGVQKLREKPFFKIKDNKLPFLDNSFDWLICSHVLEHVERESIHDFCEELRRVSSKIYIEFPAVLYELTHDIEGHVNILLIKHSTIYFIEKKKFAFFSSEEKELLRFLFLKLQNQKAYKEYYTQGYVFRSEELNLIEISSLEELTSLIVDDYYQPRKPSLFHKSINYIQSVLRNSSINEDELQKLLK